MKCPSRAGPLRVRVVQRSSDGLFNIEPHETMKQTISSIQSLLVQASHITLSDIHSFDSTPIYNLNVADRLPKERCIYFVTDDSISRLFYIGLTSNLKSRWIVMKNFQGIINREGWSRILLRALGLEEICRLSWMSCTEEIQGILELVLIQTLKPEWNRTGQLVTQSPLRRESQSDEKKKASKNDNRKSTAADPVVKSKVKKYLTESEMVRFLKAGRSGRHSARDYCLMLLAYRHGLRVSELIDIRTSEVDIESANLYVRRSKGSTTTQQPIEGDELRAIRAWLRERSVLKCAAGSPFLFLGERGPLTRQAMNYLCKEIGERAKLGFRVHPHMLRHSCGYALANKGYDTRLIQDYLGHKNIRHTVIYTQTNSKRFEGMWRT